MMLITWLRQRVGPGQSVIIEDLVTVFPHLTRAEIVDIAREGGFTIGDSQAGPIIYSKKEES